MLYAISSTINHWCPPNHLTTHSLTPKCVKLSPALLDRISPFGSCFYIAFSIYSSWTSFYKWAPLCPLSVSDRPAASPPPIRLFFVQFLQVVNGPKCPCKKLNWTRKKLSSFSHWIKSKTKKEKKRRNIPTTLTLSWWGGKKYDSTSLQFTLVEMIPGQQITVKQCYQKNIRGCPLRLHTSQRKNITTHQNVHPYTAPILQRHRPAASSSNVKVLCPVTRMFPTEEEGMLLRRMASRKTLTRRGVLVIRFI